MCSSDLYVPTNGSFPDRTVAAIEEVLDKAENTIVRLGLDKVRPNDKVSV